MEKFYNQKISPITKRRTIFGSSAGRVQSPTLKILCEREREIDIFEPKEFWDTKIILEDNNKNLIECIIVSVENKKYNKLLINKENIANELKKRILNEN